MSSATPELGSLVVRAGAGAGKTTRLVQQVLDVAKNHQQNHGRYPSLMLTTFTRKATQELRERLMLKAVELGDESLLEYLSGPQLHVSTIHGVLSVFLKRFGHLAGLDNAFQMVSPAVTQRMAKSVLRKQVLESEEASDLVSVFGFHRLTHLLIQLSGKLYEHPSLSPSSLTDMEWTWRQLWKQFFDESEPRLGQMLSETDNEKYIDYINTLMQIQKDLAQAESASQELLDRCLQRLPSKPRFNSKNPQIAKHKDDELKAVVEDLKKLAGLPEMNPEHWPQLASWYEKLHAVASSFRQNWYEAKLEKAMLDSDDLESFTLHVLQNFTALAEAFSQDTDYWLIDEYQDTSPLQVQVLQALSQGRSQFIVGDPQQSIYLFRGSDVSVFSNQEQKMKDGAGRFEQLSRNWRSQPELLEFFNALFGAMGSAFEPMLPRAEISEPEKVVATLAVTSAEDLEEQPQSQNQAIAQHIESLIEAGSDFDQICVLARTNAQLKDVAKFLKQRGFPTHLHASGGFFKRREIIDAMALLKFLVNPLDNKTLLILLRSPWLRIDDQSLAEWTLSWKGAYWPQLKEEQSEHPVVQALCSALSRGEKSGLVWVFEECLMELGLFDFCRYQDATGRRESNLWKLLHTLKEEEKRPGFSYLKFISGSNMSSEGEEFESESDAIASLEPNHIQLMTVHASKGLQFEHVILPGLEKGARPTRSKTVEVDTLNQLWSAPLPVGANDEWSGTPIDLLGKRLQKQREQEESLRVFYVAATRAKSSIFMSWNEGKVKPESWAKLVPFATDEETTHRLEKFSVRVLRSPFAETTLKDRETSALKVRPRLNFEFESQALTQVSVTKMVKQSLEEKSQMSGAPEPGSAEMALPKKMLPKIYRKTADGVYFHRVMESLYYDKAFDYRPIAENWFNKDAESVIAAVDWTLQLEQPPMSELLDSGHVEWGFQFIESGQIVEGQIDLWGIVDDLIWLVDYKTGRKEEQDKALLQLKIYAKALRAAGYQQPIVPIVLFPMDQLVVTGEKETL